jgi:hypothetical protein
LNLFTTNGYNLRSFGAGDQHRSADVMSQQPDSSSSSDNETPDNYREAFQVSGYLQIDVSTNKPFIQRVGRFTRSSQSEFFFATSMSQKNISSSLISPCEQASKAAMACLDQNNYNHAKCREFFQTYRDCKKTWVGTWYHLGSLGFTCIRLPQINQRREDRKKGIV